MRSWMQSQCTMMGSTQVAAIAGNAAGGTTIQNAAAAWLSEGRQYQTLPTEAAGTPRRTMCAASDVQGSAVTLLGNPVSPTTTCHATPQPYPQSNASENQHNIQRLHFGGQKKVPIYPKEKEMEQSRPVSQDNFSHPMGMPSLHRSTTKA